MTFSPLTNEKRLVRHKKYQSRKGRKVTRVIVHHWAGVGAIDWVLNKFVYAKNTSSVNYIMRNTGHLIGSVSEKYRAWTSNSYAADVRAITIEIENETGKPDYKVSDASIEKLTQLLVDIAKRHGWKRIRFGKEVRGHREFYSTSCPGPYLWPRLPAIAKEADRRLRGGKKKPAKPKPVRGKKWPDTDLKITRKHTAASHAAWVKLLADVGYKDKSLTTNFQRWLKKLKDKNGRSYYRGIIEADRGQKPVFGPYLVDALQRKLKDDGLYKGQLDAFRRPYSQSRGAMMIRAEVNYLNSQRRFY